MSVVSVQNVGKVYYATSKHAEDVQALDCVSFDIGNNEFCSILGHSGCGKTTLLNIVAGFEQLTDGAILVDGNQVGAPDWRRTVIFQDYALFPWLSVAANVEFGLRMKGVEAADRNNIVSNYIGLVGLKGFENHYPHQLSGGMKQRVAIARALAVEPDVLLMDEPFAALDAQTRAQMQEEMGRLLAADAGVTRKTMLLVTHSIEEAILLSDRIIVLSRRPGRVKANVTVDLARPRSEKDSGFMEMKDYLHGLLVDNPTETSIADAPVLIEKAAAL